MQQTLNERDSTISSGWQAVCNPRFADDMDLDRLAFDSGFFDTSRKDTEHCMLQCLEIPSFSLFLT